MVGVRGWEGMRDGMRGGEERDVREEERKEWVEGGVERKEGNFGRRKRGEGRGRGEGKIEWRGKYMSRFS